MTKKIFRDKSWADFHRAHVARATADVKRLPRHLFSDPSLAGRLDRIVVQHTAKIATLGAPTGGKARAEGEVTDDYGSRRYVEKKLVDVTIPFTGSAESFGLSASNCHMMAANYDMRGQALVLTLPDDEGLSDAVEDFIRRATHNLDLIRAEMKQAEPELKQAVYAAAERMKQEIAAEGARDAKVNFKIER